IEGLEIAPRGGRDAPAVDQQVLSRAGDIVGHWTSQDMNSTAYFDRRDLAAAGDHRGIADLKLQGNMIFSSGLPGLSYEARDIPGGPLICTRLHMFPAAAGRRPGR